MKVLALLTILVSCFFDPLRDTTYGKVSWIRWHTYKWLSFYPPLVYVTCTAFDVWWVWGVIAIGAWAVWQLGLYVAGSPWESVWVRLIKSWF